MPIKTVVIFGTRPDAIKMAPIIRCLEQDDRFSLKTISTAQHRSMLDDVLKVFNIKPDYDLNVMKARQTLPQLTGNLIYALDKIFANEGFDLVLVQGDTTSTFVGALISFYYHTVVGHVEAGLRTGDKYHPFPEEMNRKITGVLADIHFAPLQSNKEYLLREGVSEEDIYVTGNTVVDAILAASKKPFFPSNELKSIFKTNRKIILITAHRRENWGKPLENICKAISLLARRYPDLEFVYPVHLNPAVREIVFPILSSQPNILLISPLDYITFSHLISRSFFILSDSGGIQEEAPTFKKPVLLLRETTERQEAVKCGSVKLVGTSKDKIYENAVKLMEDRKFYDSMSVNVRNPFGDGKVSERIKNAILHHFGIANEFEEWN
ncbi:MAG: UDP-N-acetylglucosamine 2-epimerase (non-hydrolyzing) [Thermotoga sp.]|nr:UDP-N-acetylglucosamine 2-epimerase (non-hydrolyzing) [Thermotogota bacterium]RKX52223.1 MAG: UDP-N-acetylglucosamine 2-epimerase (non-hydrolyzing) [Thermotoga sp.]